MATWKLSTLEKKNVELVTEWALEGDSVKMTEWYRWGSWTTTSDAPPDIDLDNPDVYDLYASGLEWELEDMTDTVAVFWEWPEHMDEQAQADFIAMVEEEGAEAPCDAGWDLVGSQVYLHGELELTESAT